MDAGKQFLTCSCGCTRDRSSARLAVPPDGVTGARILSRDRSVAVVDALHRRGKMKAIVRDTYGSADVLELRSINTPVVEDDDVLVQVHAAGVDQGVWHIIAGLP